MRTFALLPLVLVASPVAHAGITDFVTQVTPSFRGAPGARYDGYDVLTQAAILPNFADLPGSCAGSSLTQLDPAAILTSSGNIYSFGTVTDWVLDLPDADVIAEMSIQTRSLGNPLDPASFLLEGTDANGNAISLPATQINALSGTPGEDQMVWDAASLAGLGLTDARVTFNASGPSCSTDVIVVDYMTDRDALETDVDTISVAGGGTQTFDIDGGADSAGDFYFVLGSLTGTAPGLPLGGVTIPLLPDAYTDLTLGSANTGPFANTFGNLDACGRASASFSLPAGSSAKAHLRVMAAASARASA